MTSLVALLLVLAIIPSVFGASITYNVQRFRKVKFENLLKNANGLYDIVSRTERKFVSITLFNVCVYCNRSQKTSQPVMNNKYETRRSRVAWLLSFTRCDVFCDLLQYTHKEKRYLFVLYNKTSKGLLKDSTTSPLTWSDVEIVEIFLLRKIVIYLVGRKFHLHRLFSVKRFSYRQIPWLTSLPSTLTAKKSMTMKFSADKIYYNFSQENSKKLFVVNITYK